MKNVITVLLMIMFGMVGCSTPKASYKAGEIYSIEDGEGQIGIVKVLVAEQDIIHIMIYKNKFDARPKNIDPGTLALGRLGEEGGFGIGHIPMDLEAFEEWRPELLTTELVSEEELEGYKIWLEN